MSPPEADPSVRIDVLDGWRAVSVLAVVYSHLQLVGQIPFKVFPWLGATGVQIFFVISGFVICRGLLAEVAEFRRVCLPAFYVRRCFRILPPLLLYVCVLLVIQRLDISIAEGYPHNVLRGLTFTCNLPNLYCGWLEAHLWSLSVEEQFYLVIPAVFIALSGVGRRSGVLAVAMLLLPALTLALFAAGQSSSAKFLFNFISIGFGVAWALHPRIVDEITRRLGIAGFVIALCGVGLLSSYTGTRAATALQTSLLSPLIVLMLSYTVAVPSRVGLVLASKPALVIGGSSYSLYIWQQLAVTLAKGTGAATTLVLVVALIAFALASTRYFEHPLMRLGKTIARRMQCPARPSTASV